MAKRYTLEIAVSTPDEALLAASNGADRLELSSGLELGGLTPSLHTFQVVRETVTIPVCVLLRPRPGGFEYSVNEFEVMLRDAHEFLKHGADGIVFGILFPGGIDRGRCQQLVKLAKGRAVFHRAFDFLPEPLNAIEELIEMGFQRVLTSGKESTAENGGALLRELVRYSGKRLDILPAGNVRPDNVRELVLKTGCEQVHSSARAIVSDKGLKGNLRFAMGMGADVNGCRMTTDPGLVSGLRRELDRLA